MDHILHVFKTIWKKIKYCSSLQSSLYLPIKSSLNACILEPLPRNNLTKNLHPLSQHRISKYICNFSSIFFFYISDVCNSIIYYFQFNYLFIENWITNANIAKHFKWLFPTGDCEETHEGSSSKIATD